MKDNQTKKLQVTADTAEAEEKEAAAELGKFKDVQALMEAYRALEAEFTRRSQRLKELEASNERRAPAADGQAAEAESAVTPAEETAANAPVHSQRAENSNPATVAGELDDEVKNAVIEEYLNGVFSRRGVPFVTGGGAVAAQRRTPVTVKEAGALAGKLFNNKEE